MILYNRKPNYLSRRMKKLKKTKKYHIKKKTKKVMAVKKTVKVYKQRRKITKIPSVVIDTPVKLPRKRRTKNGAKRKYFDQSVEDAIILYNNTEDIALREEIFNTKILHALQKLVECVLNTFKFSYFETGPVDVQRECLSHIVANMHKFDPTRVSKVDPTKKAKAFAYFSIIAKHYLILLNNTNYKKFNQNVEISDDRDEHTVQLQSHDKHYAKQEMSDFIQLIIRFWENNVDKIFSKQRDRDIANAVVELIRNSNNISIFNKKAIYLFIREIAQVNTQMITKILNRMKTYHEKMRLSYQNYGTVETELSI